MTFFALNSILCRAALVSCHMGPLQYTSVRCLSASLMLSLLCLAGGIRTDLSGEHVLKSAWKESSWPGGIFLFLYMICFSLGYVDMPSAAGTLIINISVQFCMVGWGIRHGLRPNKIQSLGLALACLGLFALISPGLTAPPLWNALLMAGSGLAWGGYSLCGRKASSAPLATSGNFFRAAILAAAAAPLSCWLEQMPSPGGLACALAAGALASAFGYILWYSIVPRYSLLGASVIQLSVPPVTALLAVLLLSEPVTMRLVLCSILILGGIFLSLQAKRTNKRS